MVAVCSSGFILDIFGLDRLWVRTVSDTNIFRVIMDTQQFKGYFKSDDICILNERFQRAKNERLKRSIESIDTVIFRKNKLNLFSQNKHT